MIGRHRRYAAPVVDAGGDQSPISPGLRLGGAWMFIAGPNTIRAIATVHSMSSASGSGASRHAGVVLGAEILDDDFLDMAVSAVQRVDRQQRLDALRAGFADADQDAGGERHLELPAASIAASRAAGVLSGEPWCGPPRAQPRRHVLQHHALRHRHLAERGDVGLAHHAGIDVGQEPGFAEHQRAHRGEIIDRGPVAEPGQRPPRRLVFQLRLVAEREQRLLAAGIDAGRAIASTSSGDR